LLSSQARWVDRRSEFAPSYAAAGAPGTNTTGIPWEVVIRLANKCQKDLWINIPGHADDDYIVQLATLMKKNADPSLFIYYEYANEVWNWG
jgi:hypothetical protein